MENRFEHWTLGTLCHLSFKCFKLSKAKFTEKTVAHCHPCLRYPYMIINNIDVEDGLVNKRNRQSRIHRNSSAVSIAEVKNFGTQEESVYVCLEMIQTKALKETKLSHCLKKDPWIFGHEDNWCQLFFVLSVQIPVHPISLDSFLAIKSAACQIKYSFPNSIAPIKRLWSSAVFCCRSSPINN